MEKSRYRRGLPLPEIGPELSRIIAKSPWDLSIIPMDESERYDRMAAIRSLAALELFLSNKRLTEVADFLNGFAEITSPKEAAALVTEIADNFIQSQGSSDPDQLISDLLIKAMRHLS